MFQNAKSWDKWVDFFNQRGYHCIAPAWPLHEGDPLALKEKPPKGLGELSLEEVMEKMEHIVQSFDQPIVIGHSVGGLIVQLLLRRGMASIGVAINSVAPNGMLDLNWDFLKNATLIMNPLKGNDPFYMDAKTFHNIFANTLTEKEAEKAYLNYVTHDSRNVLRDCVGKAGEIDTSLPHKPLLLISGEKDHLIPTALIEKNFKAYTDKTSVIEMKEFSNRSHYICGEPNWEEVADYVYNWLEELELS